VHLTPDVRLVLVATEAYSSAKINACAVHIMTCSTSNSASQATH
jgi:hypothetical protein